MDIEKAVGMVQVSLGSNNIIDKNGNIREVNDADLIYHGEQLYGADMHSLLQIKYAEIVEPAIYNGIFSVLVDDSVMLDLDGCENMFIDDIML